MDKLIEKFPAQLKEGIDIGEKAVINPHSTIINKVVIIGMGGSGIGGDFVSGFVSEEAKIPVLVSKSYTVPNYIDTHTLVIVSSYSGNTEETLMAFESIISSGAKIVCVTSGGKVLAKAKENNFDYVLVPGNWPSPRACLGYSIVAQLSVLNKLHIIGDDILKSIKSSVDIIKFNMEDIQIEAKKIAHQLFDKIPVIYSTNKMSSVATRFKQQINENAKGLAWTGVVPEMNHNELVGWRKYNKNLAVVYFRYKEDLTRNNLRIDINKKIIGDYCDTIIDIIPKGKTLVEQAMYHVHIGDWISYYLSQLKKMDSIEVKAIDYLKSELSKV